MLTKNIQKVKAVALQIDWRRAQRLAFILFMLAAVYFLMVQNVYAEEPAPVEPPAAFSDTTSKEAPEGAMDGSLFAEISDFLFQGLSPMEQVLCSILLLIVGDVGRGVATLAVMSLGIGAMMGKVSWGQALTVVSGIGIMFGSTLILPFLLFDPYAIVQNAVKGDFNSILQNNINYPCIQIHIPET